MARKVITFIGADNYQITRYEWNQISSDPTQYLHIALKQFYPAYTVIVLATNEAREEHGAALNGFQTCPIDQIVSDDDMWKAFDVIQKQINSGDQIVFDITHSFRSLPFLALLTIAYLRVIRDFELEAVLYAPYGEYRSTPVYNLIRFVDLLDWTTATHLFLKAGYAEDLVQRLENAQWLETGAQQTMQQVAAALRLARPDEARQSAFEWAQVDIEPDDLKLQARPFALLMKRVQKEFLDIAPDEPDQGDLKQELEQQLAVINWNLGRGQILSAVTVAREWLVSALCWAVGWNSIDNKTDSEGNSYQEPEWRSEEVRKPHGKAEKALSALKDLAQLPPGDRDRAAGSKTPVACRLYKNRPEFSVLLGEIWQAVSDLRNDLNHAGMVHSTTPRSLDEIVSEVNNLHGRLEELAKHLWSPETVPPSL